MVTDEKVWFFEFFFTENSKIGIQKTHSKFQKTLLLLRAPFDTLALLFSGVYLDFVARSDGYRWKNLIFWVFFTKNSKIEIQKIHSKFQKSLLLLCAPFNTLALLFCGVCLDHVARLDGYRWKSLIFSLFLLKILKLESKKCVQNF